MRKSKSGIGSRKKNRAKQYKSKSVSITQIAEISLGRQRADGELATVEQVANRPEILEDGLGEKFMDAHDEFIAENPDHWSIDAERFVSGIVVKSTENLKDDE